MPRFYPFSAQIDFFLHPERLHAVILPTEPVIAHCEFGRYAELVLVSWSPLKMRLVQIDVGL